MYKLISTNLSEASLEIEEGDKNESDSEKRKRWLATMALQNSKSISLNNSTNLGESG